MQCADIITLASLSWYHDMFSIKILLFPKWTEHRSNATEEIYYQNLPRGELERERYPPPP